MPFLRVIRDKRGYETTYLMDWHREGDRQRSHILYVFRTPGGARVGREALEPEVRSEVEARYPHITFDWNAVLKSQQVVEAASEPRRPRKRPRTGEEDDAPRTAPGGTGAEPEGGGPAAVPVPALIEGTTPDERVAFLARWYPLLRDRIVHRTQEPERQEALLALVERLNPTVWSDADQITAGLQQAVDALDRLSRVLGKRRRRARRPPKPAPSATQAPSDSTP